MQGKHLCLAGGHSDLDWVWVHSGVRSASTHPGRGKEQGAA